MGPAQRHDGHSAGSMATVASRTVLGGETTCLLDLPSAGSRPSIIVSSAFDGPGDEYTKTDEKRRSNGGPEGNASRWTSDGVRIQSYHSEAPSMLMEEGTTPEQSPQTGRRRKMRFPSLTPAPGSFRNSAGSTGGAGVDTRASEAVAHARKTWAPPALRTQAVASYGAVPDLEVIPEDTEVKRFQLHQELRRYMDLGCPSSCVIS